MADIVTPWGAHGATLAPKNETSDPLGGQMPPLRHSDGATWEPEGHPDSKNTFTVPENVKNRCSNTASRGV